MSATVSCVDNVAADVDKQLDDAGLVKFTIASPDGSRTAYGALNDRGQFPIVWKSGDRIGIYSPKSASGSNETQVNMSVNATTIVNGNLRWSSTNKTDHDFYCLYPYELRAGVEADAYVVALPASVSLKPTTDASGKSTVASDMKYAVMTGHTVAPYKSEEVELRFTQAVTALEITVTPPAEGMAIVNAITLESADGTSPLAGTVKFNADAVAAHQTDCFTTVSGSPTLTVSLTEPVYLTPSRSLKITAFVLPSTSPINVTVYSRAADNTGLTSRSVTTLPSEKIKPLAYNRVATAPLSPSDANYGDWLASVPGNTYVSDLSLIGTHDAGAIGSYSSSVTSSVNQTLSLQQQLDAGYRVLDLRMRWKSSDGNGTYVIAHESTQFGDYNEAGLKPIDEWLAAHPTEGVIIRFRNEGEQSGWKERVGQYLKASNVADRLITVFDPSMTVSDLRGKVLFIATDDYNGDWVGAKVSWGNNATFGSKPFLTGSGYETGWVYFTDRYSNGSILTPSESDKKADILAILEQAKANHEAKANSKWCWTWLNVSGLGSPGKNSDTYVKYVTDYINALPTDKYQPVGMVMLDWAGRAENGAVDCAKTVIDNNFRATAAGSWPNKK